MPEREEGYVYFTDDFRVKRLDKFSLVCEEFKEVTNPKTKETRVGWVQAGGYYGSWESVYRYFSVYLERAIPATGGISELVQAFKGTQKVLESLLVQGQMMSALEVPCRTAEIPVDITPEERIQWAIVAHNAHKPNATSVWQVLQEHKTGPAYSSPHAPEDKPVTKPKRRAKVESVVPPEPTVATPIDEDDDWV